jgi:hypothetical protein
VAILDWFGHSELYLLLPFVIITIALPFELSLCIGLFLATSLYPFDFDAIY